MVREPNPAYQDRPYTLQFGRCGQQGVHIHLTPDFIRDTDNTFVSVFGPKGKKLE